MGYIGNQPFLGTATGESIADGSIGTVDLSDGAVTAAKLATTAILDKLGYTPVSTSGTGATGTWGVSISGNAATATTAVTATNVSGGTASVTSLTNSGNLTFSSTAQRITGDFSNATASNRLLFQTSTTNGNSFVGNMPNGTGSYGAYISYNGSDPANSSSLLQGITSTDARLVSTAAGTGSLLPLTFYTGGSERMRLDTSGNLGIGRAPNYKLDAYLSGTGSPAIASSNDNIVTVLQSVGSSQGNVGTITSHPLVLLSANTERMRIDSSGNVGIGKTPAAGRLLDVNADSWFNGVRVGRGSLSNNTIVGSNALISTTTGDFNVAIGFEAGNANTTGYQNTFVGYRAGLTNTTAIFNTGIGCNALQAATTGAGNTAVGNQCLQLTTTGGNNSAVGVYALYANTTGSLNTAIGYAASMGQTTALYNVAVGAYSLHYTTTGSANTSTGYYSLLNCTTGGNNTGIGYYSGTGITTGSHNVLIGQQAGYHSVGIVSGVANICVGNYADVQASSDNYSIVIGYLAQGKGSSTGFIAPYNGGAMYQGNNSSSWATTSDRRIKKNIVDNTVGLEKINQIRVCNFEYRTKDEIDPSIPQSSAVPKAGVQLGVIAQEIQQIIPECVKEESTGVLSVDTDRVIWHLVNAVKELSAQVDALKARTGE